MLRKLQVVSIKLIGRRVQVVTQKHLWLRQYEYMHGSMWLTRVKAGMVKKTHIWGTDHWEMMVLGIYVLAYDLFLFIFFPF